MKEVGKKVILMIDDDAGLFGPPAEYFLGLKGYELRTATTLDAGKLLYDQLKSELAGILMDGCVGEGVRKVNSIPLIQKIREDGFTGPIVAMSRALDYCELMVTSGCDCGVENKHEAGLTILKILEPGFEL